MNPDSKNGDDAAVPSGKSTSAAATADQVTSQPVVQQRAINVAPLGIVIADATQRDLPIVFCNPAFERMTGYSATEIVGHNCRFLQGDDRNQHGINVLRRAIADQQHGTAVLRNYRKDGQMFWCEVSVTPVRDTEQRVTHP